MANYSTATITNDCLCSYYRFIGGFKEYTSIVGIFGEKMGPPDDPGRLNTMVGLIYDLISSNQGRAGAGALILFGIILVVTLINLQVSKKKVHY